MKIIEQKTAYERYLTERLDSGQSQNVVISTVADILQRKIAEKRSAKVLDIGCFSGAMLNRIRSEIPSDVAASIEFVGADIDEEILEIGRRKYQGLNLWTANLSKSINQLGSFDVVILANIIHEIFPKTSDIKKTQIESQVKRSLNKVSQILLPNGYLVLLDGVKPRNEDYWITINFKNTQATDLYIEFSKKYKAFPILIDKSGSHFRTRMKDLAAFLTKSRYLNEKYWQIESVQNYQYFTEGQFIETIVSCGLIIERVELQRFSGDYINKFFTSTEPPIEFPAKNILIVAIKP